MNYDLIIIGGGPGGASAGVYAARKRLKTVLITETFGGQSTESVGIQNWIGTKEISGEDFGKSLKEHVLHYASDILDIRENEKVEKVEKTGELFKVKTNKGEYLSKTVLVTTGSHRRKLDVPGSKELEGKGIVYCASCDGPLFSGTDTVVIGGGNAALESAAQLLAYAKSVTILNRSETLRGDEITIESISKNPKLNIIKNAVIKEVKGDKFVKSIIYTNKTTNEDKELAVSGVFVEIGLLPSTWFVEGLVEMNEYKQIKVDPRTQKTSTIGVWAAGDCTDGLFHQNNIAAGDAVKALEDIYLHISRNSK